MRHVGRWLADWRNGVTIVATAAVCLIGFLVFDGARARDHALKTARDAIASQQREARDSGARIDRLTATVDDLTDELGAVLAARTDTERAAAVAAANERRATTTTTVRRQSTRSATTTTTRPPVAPSGSTTTTTARRPPASSTTTTNVPPPPPPQPCPTLPVLGVCRP